MNRHCLMAREDRESDFPVSRDWADVNCAALGCNWNRNGKCGVPSLYAIGEDGRCTGFTPKPLPAKIDGD